MTTTASSRRAPHRVWLPLSSGPPSDAVSLRVFCFPHAGGGASSFRSWAKDAPPEVDVCPVQLPGRENRYREQPATDVAVLVPHLARGLLPLLDLPFVFFGHSMGAILALETAKYLWEKYSISPVRLVASSSLSPQPLRKMPAGALCALPDEEFVQVLHERFGGIPADILRSPDLLPLFLPVLRADFALIESHESSGGPPLRCPITVLRGDAESGMSEKDLAGWAAHSEGETDFMLIPGGHFAALGRGGQILTAVLSKFHTSTQGS